MRSTGSTLRTSPGGPAARTAVPGAGPAAGTTDTAPQAGHFAFFPAHSGRTRRRLPHWPHSSSAFTGAPPRRSAAVDPHARQLLKGFDDLAHLAVVRGVVQRELLVPAVVLEVDVEPGGAEADAPRQEDQ